MPKRQRVGVPRTVQAAIITCGLILLTVVISQATNTSLLSKLTAEAAREGQRHSAARLEGPTSDTAAHPLGPIARFTIPEQHRNGSPIGTPVHLRAIDPPAGAIMNEDSKRLSSDRYDVEDGDRDDSHSHHHNHHHP